MPKRAKTPRSPKAPIRCEGVILEVGTPGLAPKKALALAKSVVADTLPGKWRVERFAAAERTFYVSPGEGRRRPPVGRYWEWCRELEENRDVVAAEPAFVLPGVDPAPEQVFAKAELSLRGKSVGGGRTLSCSDGYEWSLDECRVRTGWSVSPPSRRYGKGIRVGHPDTGYTKHPDFFDPSRVLVREGYDFEDGNEDAADELSGQNPGHGTATGSVVVSDIGPNAVAHVTGVAPEAMLVPYRVSTSVIHLSFRKLAEAIHFAASARANQRPRVLSMSLGGPFKARYLKNAIDDAIRAGIVPIAAAGNIWPFVVYPARFPEVVAVAATNCRSQPWSGSASGSSVDVSAPGESVWRARSKKNEPYTVDRSSGTSYATAMVAGACALWLAHYGYTELVNRYARENVAAVFREVLTREGVRRPPGWDTARYGSGILDVERLLRAPLPPTAPAGFVPKVVWPVRGLAGYFPEEPPAKIRKAFCTLLHVSDRELDHVLATLGDELEFHVATNPEFRFRVAAFASRRKAKLLPKGAPKPAGVLGTTASKGLRGRLSVPKRSRKKR
jgi:thermitase